MAHLHTARPQRSFFAGLSSECRALRDEFARRRQVAESMQTLEKMTDRQLDDIGIPRHRIARSAYQSVYGQSPVELRR